MGQKDYQQCMVVKKLLAHLDFAVELVTLRHYAGGRRAGHEQPESEAELRKERKPLQLFIERLLFIKENIRRKIQPLLNQRLSPCFRSGGFEV